MKHTRGTLYLVVGPSGAGKDSVLDGAKAALNANGDYIFPRRYITRPAHAGGEDHIPVSDGLFETMVGRGDLLLNWRAHNLRYGVPGSVGDHLAQGRNVVVNVSRTVVDEARATLAPIQVLYITVADEVLRQRLIERGRESKSDIEKRVARAQEYLLSGDDVHMIDNSGELSVTISSFLMAIGSSPVSSADNI